ncbi:MAG: hypothetical protein AAF587_05015 [Bacteroidota bacterium]
MKQIIFFLLIGILLLVSSACKDPIAQIIPPIPEIELLNTTPTNVIEYQDEIVFTIEYTDGDGDLGTNDDTRRNVFIKDSRIDNIHEFRLQQLAPDGAEVPITGTFELTLPYTILTAGTTQETVSFEIHVVDEAGNESNVVTSPEIQINPQ